MSKEAQGLCVAPTAPRQHTPLPLSGLRCTGVQVPKVRAEGLGSPHALGVNPQFLGDEETWSFLEQGLAAAGPQASPANTADELTVLRRASTQQCSAGSIRRMEEACVGERSGVRNESRNLVTM